MSKLKTLSGKDVVRILEIFGFNMAAQKGSHIKLTRNHDNSRQTLTIPNHPELDKGTTKAIYRQILKYLPEEEVKDHFYTK